MTRYEAETFLALPDRSRTAALQKPSPRERVDALAALVVALATPEQDVEELAA